MQLRLSSDMRQVLIIVPYMIIHIIKQLGRGLFHLFCLCFLQKAAAGSLDVSMEAETVERTIHVFNVNTDRPKLVVLLTVSKVSAL